MSDPLNKWQRMDEAMPEFKPLPPMVAPGAEPVRYDPRTQSIMDAFSISDQERRWLSKQLAVCVNNLGLLYEKMVDLATVETRVSAIENKPYQALMKALSHFGTALVGAAAAYLFFKFTGASIPHP